MYAIRSYYVMVTINTMMVLEFMHNNKEYDSIITNITLANDLNAFIKPAIDTEMWRNNFV